MRKLSISTLNLKCLAVLGVLFLPFLSWGQFDYEGPIPRITSGYGSFGSYAVESQFFYLAPDSTIECEDTVRAIITYPVGISSPKPTVFRFPGASNNSMADSVYWRESQFYREFVASNGYVSVTMQWNSSSHYGCSYHLLRQAAKQFSNMIDTSRVGIHGMSQGGAVTNWLSLKKFINDGWGQNGRFAWPDAGASFVGFIDDWPVDIATQTDSGLAAMPDDVLYLMTYSDWDQTPDPRMCIDMYNFMGVPDSNKEFFIIKGDTINNYIYWATHFTTNTYDNDSSQFNVYVTKHDALDYWLGTRLLHSLMETAWNGDTAARRICMGNGDPVQTTIAGGAMRGPIVTDQPWMTMIASWNSGLGYMNPCEVSWNMRQYVTADACFTMDVPEISELHHLKVYPNPAKIGQQITLESSSAIASLDVFNELGRMVLQTTKNTFTLDYPGWFVLGITYEDGSTQATKLYIPR
jgi:hypothetical protein